MEESPEEKMPLGHRRLRWKRVMRRDLKSLFIESFRRFNPRTNNPQAQIASSYFPAVGTLSKRPDYSKTVINGYNLTRFPVSYPLTGTRVRLTLVVSYTIVHAQYKMCIVNLDKVCILNTNSRLVIATVYSREKSKRCILLQGEPNGTETSSNDVV